MCCVPYNEEIAPRYSEKIIISLVVKMMRGNYQEKKVKVSTQSKILLRRKRSLKIQLSTQKTSILRKWADVSNMSNSSN